jgi:hypothetical protein
MHGINGEISRRGLRASSVRVEIIGVGARLESQGAFENEVLSVHCHILESLGVDVKEHILDDVPSSSLILLSESEVVVGAVGKSESRHTLIEGEILGGILGIKVNLFQIDIEIGRELLLNAEIDLRDGLGEVLLGII